jgi:hypothetical protein
MARKRKRGEIVDLEARRTQRRLAALADANHTMLQAEEALFELLRDAGREDRRKVVPSPGRSKRKTKALEQPRELPALASERAADAPEDPSRGRVLPFRRVRAA